MAMYTQVTNTVGYVSLNALEYLMQTVSAPALPSSQHEHLKTDLISTSTRFCTRLRPSSSTRLTVEAPVVCCHAWVVWLVS